MNNKRNNYLCQSSISNKEEATFVVPENCGRLIRKIHCFHSIHDIPIV